MAGRRDAAGSESGPGRAGGIGKKPLRENNIWRRERCVARVPGERGCGGPGAKRQRGRRIVRAERRLFCLRTVCLCTRRERLARLEQHRRAVIRGAEIPVLHVVEIAERAGMKAGRDQQQRHGAYEPTPLDCGFLTDRGVDHGGRCYSISQSPSMTPGNRGPPRWPSACRPAPARCGGGSRRRRRDRRRPGRGFPARRARLAAGGASRLRRPLRSPRRCPPD